MKKIAFVLLSLISVQFISGQNTPKDPVLMSIDGKKDILLSEFEAIYKKNNTEKEITEQGLNEYLDLFIKFKLKVTEAEDLGMDTLPKFKNELAGYRKQLAQPYLTDKEVTEELIKEAYERLKYDIKGKHILVRIDADALPADTLKAYKKIKQIKDMLKTKSFDEVMKEVQKNSFKQNALRECNYWDPQKGDVVLAEDLGYFSALYMVYPFETAAYNTKPGEVSDIVRTRFGYHIVKVEDKRPARGNIKVAHIMVRIKKDATDEERENAEKKINEIYDKLQQGEDFAELAKQYSDDKGSASKGGELPVFSTGRMVASFEDAAFSLKEDGEISKPVLTEFGWHIIKRISLKDLGTYDEEYERIKAKVARDSRSNKSKETMISRIQKEYGFKENLKAKDAFAKVLDDSFFEAKWDVKKAEKLNDFLFGFYAPDGDKKEVTQQDFANYLSTHQMNVRRSSDKMDIRVALNKAYKNFVEEQTLAFEDSRLEKKYPEFKHLMQEYRDGILLFELTDQKVWSKALKDTAGLKEFYEKNIDKYMWGERIDATIYTCANEDIAKQVRKLLKKKKKKGFTNGEIVKQINKDSQLNLKIESGKFEQGENEWVDKAGKKIGFSENFEVKNEDGKVNSIVFVEIHGIVKPEPKKISEARGLITSDYQAYLENEWVKELKNNYKVTVNKEILKMLLK